MRKEFKLTLPQDFDLVCLVTSCDPAIVLQDYINGISIPKLLSIHPDDPLGENMDLFIKSTKSYDPVSVQKKTKKFLKTGYDKDLKKLAKLDIEQPELEIKIRKIVEKWCVSLTELRQSLRTQSSDFKIVGYDD